MARKIYCAAIALVLVSAAGVSTTRDARAQGAWTNPEPNYYVTSPNPYGTTAAMYQSPRPTPPWVGETYITYEAMAPHEELYTHHRSYVRYNPGAGVTRTSVMWGHHISLNPFQPSNMWSVPALRTPVSEHGIAAVNQ